MQASHLSRAGPLCPDVPINDGVRQQSQGCCSTGHAHISYRPGRRAQRGQRRPDRRPVPVGQSPPACPRLPLRNHFKSVIVADQPLESSPKRPPRSLPYLVNEPVTQRCPEEPAHGLLIRGAGQQLRDHLGATLQEKFGHISPDHGFVRRGGPQIREQAQFLARQFEQSITADVTELTVRVQLSVKAHPDTSDAVKSKPSSGHQHPAPAPTPGFVGTVRSQVQQIVDVRSKYPLSHMAVHVRGDRRAFTA